ncbi:MAG: helix-turn-helix domain-containing protein [Acidimicrobiales bacterium]
MTDDADAPKLPFEETVGVLSFIQPRWWDENPEATSEAVAVAEWLDFHPERRQVGETIPDKPVQRLTLTVEEAASALGISRSFAYEAIAKGEIPCIRIGKRILVPKIALEKMMESAGPAGPPGS